MVKIAVVHKTMLIANIIASVLSDEDGFEVVGRAHDTGGALQIARSKDCDVMLVSALLSDSGALRLTETLSKEYPHINVLVTGLPKSKHLILQYVMAGASGYVLQDVSVENLLENVKATSQGKALASPSIVAALMTHIQELAHISASQDLDVSLVGALTPREQEVLTLIGDGLTNQEIGDKLFIEIGTVKNHVHNLLKKLEVSSREEAAEFVPFLEE